MDGSSSVNIFSKEEIFIEIMYRTVQTRARWKGPSQAGPSGLPDFEDAVISTVDRWSIFFPASPQILNNRSDRFPRSDPSRRLQKNSEYCDDGVHSGEDRGDPLDAEEGNNGANRSNAAAILSSEHRQRGEDGDVSGLREMQGTADPREHGEDAEDGNHGSRTQVQVVCLEERPGLQEVAEPAIYSVSSSVFKGSSSTPIFQV